MHDTTDSKPAGNATPQYVTDKELAPMLRVSVGWIQKDRREGQRIPFVRLGDRCLYDVQEVLASLKAATVGGARGRRGRIAGGAK